MFRIHVIEMGKNVFKLSHHDILFFMELCSQKSPTADGAVPLFLVK